MKFIRRNSTAIYWWLMLVTAGLLFGPVGKVWADLLWTWWLKP